jgi:hypothetical protein
MNTSENIVTNSSAEIDDYVIQNKGFLFLDQMFRENGWHNIKNELNWITYTRTGYETEYFDIRISKTIHVSVPIKNSPYQYKTTFTNYYDASEYVEQRFKDFIGSNSVVALSNGGDDDVIRENCILQGLEFHFSDQLFRNVRPIFAAATGLSDVGVDSCRLSAIFNLPESYRAHDPLDDARAIAGAIRSLIAAIPHIGFGSGMKQLSKPEAK